MSLETPGEPSPPAGNADLQTQFLVSLNHEIRTPLTGILGMTDLLLETPLDAEQKEYVATAKTCAEELLGLFNKILEFSELTSGRITPARRDFHLPEAIRGAVSPFTAAARAKGLRLVCRLAPSLPPVVVGDAGRLQRLVAHLVENAVKFTDTGRVEVSVSAEPSGDKPVLHLRVHDTGAGIPADKLSRVFESFHQLDAGLARRYEGLGLGLSLVKGLAALMGGGVRVASEPGKGTTFLVDLPLEVSPVGEGHPDPGPPTREAPPRERKPEILLVEDNALASTVLAHVLKRGGYRVRCAASAREAVETASCRPFDLILMDLQLPGDDGFETTRQIRDLPGHASTAVVAITAHAGDAFRRACFDNGMQGFLAKPVNAQDLLDTVAALLH